MVSKKFIIILIIISIASYLIFSNPIINSSIENIGSLMYNFIFENPFSAYLGAFIISLLSNFTIFVPIPYALIVFLLGAQPSLNPLIIALISGLGAGVGETSAYLIGYGGSKLLPAKKIDNMFNIAKKYGFLAIFLFALTPLPDDTLLIALGMLKYSFKKTITASILGKTCLCLILSYSGYYGWGFLAPVFFSNGYMGTVITIILTIIIIYLLLNLKKDNFK